MRTRVTVATSKENLGSNTRKVGTMNNLLHVVETLSFHEISRLHAVATGRRNHATVTGDSRYSELLIHGMLDLTRDVAAIVVTSQDYRKGSVTRNLIKEVSRKYLVPVLTCEELDEFLEDNRWSTVIQQRANVLVQRTMAMGNTYGSSSYL
ncbi:hypothetical protein CSUI_007952 [Cystoisospora suis]|uniref:Uncharacterized protein n=1 Tax=Cystoisospora suis TaxID=483139 RepID=A0A2C6KKX6_9APIC|nr:hypothetical protein CSUI_007952 [Cystoisospora suis]